MDGSLSKRGNPRKGHVSDLIRNEITGPTGAPAGAAVVDIVVAAAIAVANVPYVGAEAILMGYVGVEVSVGAWSEQASKAVWTS